MFKAYINKEVISLLFLGIVITLIVSGSRNYRLYKADAITVSGSTGLYIHERIGLPELADLLDSLNADFDTDELNWAARIHGWRFFRPGLYRVEVKESYPDFLSRLARGIQDPANVTIVPGTDTQRLSRQLGLQLRADSSDFHHFFSDSTGLALETGLSGKQIFSRMLPNTYQMYWTNKPEDVILRVLREFNQVIVNQYKDVVENSGYTLDEILTLASIVEWEARNADEKRRIAGLYLNRLKRNMPLQADPTVIYALGERRRLLFEDYQFDHPYNTYINSGLPPGPITNPDENSIRAVLFPEEHNYLYMVASPDGFHRFSRTFEEHRQASAEWRRWLQEQYRIRDQREKDAAESQSGQKG